MVHTTSVVLISVLRWIAAPHRRHLRLLRNRCYHRLSRNKRDGLCSGIDRPAASPLRLASMTSPESVPSPSGDAPPPSGRTRSSPHPRYTLEQTEELAKSALAMGARHCDQDAVAQSIGYKNSTNGAFKGLRAAGGYFGVIAYQDDKFLSVTEPWIVALHEEDEAERRRLRKIAVNSPELYRVLIKEFDDRQLPSADKLARQLFLSPKYGILKDAAEAAAATFLESVRFAGLVDSNNFLRFSVQPEPVTKGADGVPAIPLAPARPTTPTSPPTSTPVAPPPSTGDLDRIEVQLAGGRRAYLLVPVPLSHSEKERLKKYIDLILEPEEQTPGISAN